MVVKNPLNFKASHGCIFRVKRGALDGLGRRQLPALVFVECRNHTCDVCSGSMSGFKGVMNNKPISKEHPEPKLRYFFE